MNKDLFNFLPQKLRNTPAWKEMAEAYQLLIYDVNLDSLERIKNLRYISKADADFLDKIKDLLGVPIPIDSFNEVEKRRLLQEITYHYEVSGTKHLIDLLRFVKNAEVELYELYSNALVESEVIATGNTIDDNFTGNLLNVPVDELLGNVVITDGVQTLTDDGAGNFTGDGIGTIDYVTGAFDITFNSPPSAVDIECTYYTHLYQGFYKEDEIVGDLVTNGGSYYLTNHVSLAFDVEIFDPSGITSFFYKLAPVVSVLRSLEGILNGINQNPINILAGGFISNEEIFRTATDISKRNVILHDNVIAEILDEYNTNNTVVQQGFEVALTVGTKDTVIPRHQYIVGNADCDSAIIGNVICDDIDIFGPAGDSSEYVYGDFDSLTVQEMWRSSSIDEDIVGPIYDTHSSYRPIKDNYNYIVSQTDLDYLIIGSSDSERIHIGRYDIGYTPVNSLPDSQYQEEYTNWENNLQFGGPKLSYRVVHEPHGLDIGDGTIEIQVRYSTVSDSGPWSLWESLTSGVKFDARWLQFKLLWTKIPSSVVTSKIISALDQLDVRDKVEVKRLNVPLAGTTVVFDNLFYINPSTRIKSIEGYRSIISSIDESQITFNLVDEFNNNVSDDVILECRGY